MQRSKDGTERVDPASLLDEDGSGSGDVASGVAESDAASTSGGRLRGRLPSGPTVSIRSFLVVLALLLVGLFVGGSIPLVGAVGRFVGLFAAAFAIGLGGSRSRYLEVGLAGALASGAAFVLGTLTSVFAPIAVSVLADYGLAIAGVGVVSGLVASLAGHYFGRDLRDGLTREI